MVSAHLVHSTNEGRVESELLHGYLFRVFQVNVMLTRDIRS